MEMPSMIRKSLAERRISRKAPRPVSMFPLRAEASISSGQANIETCGFASSLAYRAAASASS